MRVTAATLLVCLVAALQLPHPTSAQTEPVLRIATWDISLADKTLFSRPKKNRKPSWRHTFGAERNDRRKSNLGVFNLDVDVVLLQGVRSLRALRRIFPARNWKLILSRDSMRHAPRLSRLPLDLQAFDISVSEFKTDHPVTAVAVRYQRHLRVRGINHISVGPSSPSNDETKPSMASTTAVKIHYFGNHLWLLSTASPVDDQCRQAGASCTSRNAIERWQQTNTGHHRDVIPIIMAEPGVSPASTGTSKSHDGQCGSLKNLSMPSGDRIKVGDVQNITREKLGCIVLAPITLSRPSTHRASSTRASN